MITEQYIEEISQRIKEMKAQKEQEIEDFRIALLGKKGELTRLFEEFRTVPAEQKRLFGQKLNLLKNEALVKIEALKEAIEQSTEHKATFDLTKPGDSMELGSRHPISITREEILSIFRKFGYSVAEGPEIEDDWHVFGALNFPPEHPARDMQDTFFINTQSENHILLRTHTSSVQVRTMEHTDLPIRVVCPGRVFRNEAISARAHCIFHQVEGLYIDKNVSFADLKQAILLFAQEMFGAETKIRMRPSYFPFTEPSAEVDVSCNICKGKGCNICKGTGWLEILGCGMVDPAVLEASGIDPKVYSGFAFGMGIERIAMLKWQVKDLRHYFENDVRFLKEFETVI
ncbi:MAG: phenylalanine--tRNA ligase subunit alpha [Bacteroidales bacterium]|nr:phenylalanine--tRNA ligase subunit alpha [Bacteroidales bacterium]